jgi:pantoate--beta-alanine ligase
MPIDKTTYAVALARTIKDMREQVASWRTAGERIGLVPTMGALHAGHLSLIDVARAKGATKIIVSIFVNPTQFGPGEDFDAYPRTEATDAEKLGASADLIFAPNGAEMYPDGFGTTVSVSGVTNTLEGEARPTHFDGVATVVSKLLLAALPDCAVFGEKDYQQLLTIRRMVTDLTIPVDVLGGPILREPDGLAMSSRNVYLTETEREAAGQLNVILRETAEAISAGADIKTLTAEAEAKLLGLGFNTIDYLTVRDTVTLAPIENLTTEARILVAAKIGQPRLLDNMPVKFRVSLSGWGATKRKRRAEKQQNHS